MKHTQWPQRLSRCKHYSISINQLTDADTNDGKKYYRSFPPTRERPIYKYLTTFTKLEPFQSAGSAGGFPSG
jgi:hypothetical protein